MVEKTNKTEEKDKSLERVIGELFKALPKELQEAILEIGIREKVLRIGEKYNLPQKEIDFLENEVMKVLITINTEGEFVENTMDGLSLEDNQLELLLDDIDNNIFTPVGKERSVPARQLLRKGTIENYAKKKKEKARRVDTYTNKEVEAKEKFKKESQKKPTRGFYTKPSKTRRFLGNKLGESSRDAKRKAARERIEKGLSGESEPERLLDKVTREAKEEVERK
jgi:hypothetical protein|tara:strand:- start:64 stop:735 length:672 start_codon:yes stop_codon:yes gene_type:complete